MINLFCVRILKFDFEIEHVAGKENQLLDFLSRNPEDSFGEEDLDATVERIAIPSFKEKNIENKDKNVLKNNLLNIENKNLFAGIEDLNENTNVPCSNAEVSARVGELNVIENVFVLMEDRQHRDDTISELKVRWRRLGNEGPQTQSEEDFLFYKVENGCTREC